MKSIVFSLALFLIHLSARAQDAFSGEIQLKAKNDIRNLMIAPDYRILIDGGNADIKFTKDGKEKDAKGTVILTILNGIDPNTKRPAKLIGWIRIEIVNSGWASDKFVTRIEIPIESTGATRKVSGSPDPQPILGFAATASVEIQWLDILANGITRYTDPMGIRMQSEYSVEVIKNPIK